MDKEKAIAEKIRELGDGELVARLQTYSEYLGVARTQNKSGLVEEMAYLDNVVAEELMRRLSINPH